MTKHITQLLIFSTLVVFYAFFAFVPVDVFNSPDETANFVFLEQYAEHNRLWYEYDFGYGPVQQYIFPRSTYSNGEVILPVGFWGLAWLYGTIAKLIGVGLVEFFTPILAAFAVFAFYGIARRIFPEDGRIALVSAIVFSAHPAWWYYSSRALLPNVSMLSFVLIGIYFVLAQPFKQKFTSASSSIITTYMDDIIGASMLCLGLLIRPSELWWLVLGFVIVLSWKRATFDWYRILAWCIPACFVAVIYVSVNGSLYGGTQVAYLSSQSHTATRWYQVFLPFGIHPRLMLSVFWHYLFKQYWWLSVVAFIGLVGFIIELLKKKITPQKTVLFVVTVTVSAYLLFLYGSFDDAGRGLNTIGIAYNRYFLPVFAMSSLYVGYVYSGIARSFKTDSMRTLYAVATIFIFGMLSFEAVWLKPDGFLQTRDALMHIQKVQNEVVQQVPKLSIIASQYEDKFFWPQFQVMQNTRNPHILEGMDLLSRNGYPVYYFTSKLSDESKQALEQEFLQYDMRIEQVYTSEPHVLYKIVADEKDSVQVDEEKN